MSNLISQNPPPQVRKSIVGYRTNGGRPHLLPQLTLKGRWLEPLGFTIGQKL
ncbi:SymE family type I addiction module toxin [Winslowiella toletana]|nr:SymE family type I addiction module toxin [Winslowiella toletana]WNN46449.1 SymE family type I addiction module toxin [Winslowiella toletana]